MKMADVEVVGILSTPQLHRSSWRRDDGYAMATALLVGVIGFAITSILAVTVIFTMRQSQRGNETVQDRSVAEAGIDTAMAAIAQSSDTKVPCAIDGDLSATEHFNVTIAYFSEAGTLLDCTPIIGVDGTPFSAVITSEGSTDAAGTAGSTSFRTMEAQVKLSGGGGGGTTSSAMSNVLYSGSKTTFNQKWTLTGIDPVTKEPPDISIGGDFVCDREVITFPGNVYASGNIELSDDCTIKKDLWGGGTVLISGIKEIANVEGNLKAPGQLTINTDSSLKVGKDLAVKPPIPTGPKLTVGGSILPAASAPKLGDFPQLSYSSEVWEGWDAKNPAKGTFPCSKADLPSGLTKPTVYLAYQGAGSACTNVNWSDTRTITLTSDVTIIADRFEIGGKFSVVSGDGKEHSLRLIVPWTSESTTCPVTPAAGNISISAIVDVSTPASLLLYTPGSVRFPGNKDDKVSIRGQIYSCSMDSNRDTALEYVMVGAPGASTVSPTPTPTSTSTSTTYTLTEEYRKDV